MNIIYNFAIEELKNFSESLKKKSLLLNKPWALIDSDEEIQKLIFKKNKELIISKNGDVIIGSWEYLPEANSLLIKRQGKTILVNEGFINEGVLILKKDGTSNDYFILANQNLIPDLDVVGFIQKLRYEKLLIKRTILRDGSKLEVLTQNNYSIETGNKVFINYEKPKNGNYISESGNIKYEIENSMLMGIYYLKEYYIKSGEKIIIEQKHNYSIQRGDKVKLFDGKLLDGKYSLIDKGKIKVKDGVIIGRPIF
ncbi:hypothetical protein [Mesonia mobilis]|uniref:Uncharacterized protein n=1 Tax=Mesonia mobilis TaxID=369791 RepID=A0ABQ3BTG4_9FLAO|nr:hypothetical protein [Mesonia mobilis]MBQ0739109.1 hypothetical protein [Aquimarina celericrescens]GGZ56417.1 hypothetical protein GCM10008088_17490 [Mesonia mobilis]